MFKNYKIIKVFFFVYLSFLMFVSNAFSEEWKASCEANFPPYNYLINNHMSGLDYDIISLVMKRIGIKFNIKTGTWNETFSLLKEEKVDFAWQFVSTIERQKLFRLVGPIRYGLHVFMVKSKSNIVNWKKLSDFDRKKVGVVKKYSYTSEFDNYKKFKKVEFDTNEQLLFGLVKGKVDIIIGDYYTFADLVKKNKYSSDIKFLPSSIKVIPRYVAFTKNNKVKALKFEKALYELINTKEYKAIIEKYSVL